MKNFFKNHANRLVMALATATIFSCSSGDEDWLPPPSEGKGNDIANYRTVKIGNQTWMAENLDYDVNGSKCYNNDPANCAKYGRLYDWATAKTVCPSGWRLPSASDWEALKSFVTSRHGDYTDAEHLKAKNGWDDCGPYGSGKNSSCEDTYGFAALPGGFGYLNPSYEVFEFSNIGREGWWWSSEEETSTWAYSTTFKADYSDGDYTQLLKSYSFISVRCVQSGANYYGNNSSSSRNNVSDIPRSSSSNNITNSEPYCYGYGNYRDCNLIGGRWIPDVQYCFSGGGSTVNADYCYRNGITIDNTPGSSSSITIVSGSVYDSRDNKNYKTVEIGSQTWMAENLNYYVNGSAFYNNQNSNCDTYGRLYDWATAMDISSNYNSTLYNPSSTTKYKGICPSGWHIPNMNEWSVLINSVGFISNLKATNGFSALLGGERGLDGDFYGIGDFGYWWSSMEEDSGYMEYGSGFAYRMDISYYDNYNDDKDWLYSYKSRLFSVRCVKD